MRTSPGTIALYHRTHVAAALQILSSGFEDRSEAEQTGVDIKGSYFSHTLTPSLTPYGPVIIAVEVPQNLLASLYEEGTDQGFAAYLVPAATINKYRPFTVLDAPPDFPHPKGSRV